MAIHNLKNPSTTETLKQTWDAQKFELKTRALLPDQLFEEILFPHQGHTHPQWNFLPPSFFSSVDELIFAPTNDC
jgi:hypothetical protein